MPKTSMPPFREFAWVQDKFGVSFNLHYQKIDTMIYKIRR